jgi:hypothetical protein
VAEHACIVRSETSLRSPQMNHTDRERVFTCFRVIVLLIVSPNPLRISGRFNEHEQQSRRMNAATIATHQEVHA